MGNDGTFYMLRLRFDAARIMELGRRRRLPLREVDTGYLVHCQLGELFGEGAPRPFAVTEDQGRMVTVLAYSDRPEAELRRHADAFADPAVHAACAWEQCGQKPMPRDWQRGQRYGFEVRLCPVVRMGREGPHWRKGAEVDAFLARCWTVGDRSVPVDREAVYREWLGDQLERRGGARLLTARMVAFNRERLLRRERSEERKASRPERPDARMQGEVEVTDPSAFAQLLRQGVGRHRGFGFGMLLLRPASREG